MSMMSCDWCSLGYHRLQPIYYASRIVARSLKVLGMHNASIIGRNALIKGYNKMIK